MWSGHWNLMLVICRRHDDHFHILQIGHLRGGGTLSLSCVKDYDSKCV